MVTHILILHLLFPTKLSNVDSLLEFKRIIGFKIPFVNFIWWRHQLSLSIYTYIYESFGNLSADGLIVEIETLIIKFT